MNFIPSFSPKMCNFDDCNFGIVPRKYFCSEIPWGSPCSEVQGSDYTLWEKSGGKSAKNLISCSFMLKIVLAKK